MFNIFLRICY